MRGRCPLQAPSAFPFLRLTEPFVLMATPPKGLSTPTLHCPPKRAPDDTPRAQVFFSGLEGLLGPPAMDVRQGMWREHCARDDSSLMFTTCNGMSTCSRDEWEFVAEPRLGKQYPERPDILASSDASRRRQPLPPSAFMDRLRKLNAKLTAEKHPALMEEEMLAGRLHPDAG